MPEQSIDIQFTLDGVPRQLSVDPKRAALSVLREELGVRSLTAGCSPQGICGCCTAIINGKPRLTCTLRAKSLNGKDIETHDSFSDAEATAVAAAFSAAGATQCGYCTPGIATQTICLLRNVPEPDDEIIDKALNQHVCRCTGWTRIREAIKLTGQLLSGAEPALPGGLATPATAAAVLGRRTRIEDMTRPGMVHLAPCFAPHARCRVTAVDIPEGVTALTAADLPAGAIIGDQPLLVALDGETRCAADVVALAIGDSAEAARAAAAAITVSAEPLELVLHPEAGEIIAEHHLTRGAPPAPDAVAHTASATVSTAAADPAFLEPDAALAVPMAEGVLRVYSHSQDPFTERARLATMLGVSPGAVQLEGVACGGSFGGRGTSQVAGWAALAATRLGRPARVSLTHEEGVRLHAGRPAAHLSITLQADADGRLLSVDGELLADGGGYGALAAAGARRAAALMAGPYDSPHLDARARCAQTHSPPAGVTRGLGGVAGALALERCMDQLAEAVGVSVVEIRRRNLSDDGHRAVLDAAAERLAAAQAAGEAAGLACAAAALGAGGEEVARIILAVQPGGEVRLHSGYLESGQGFEPRAAHAAAEVTGLPADTFVVIASTDQPVDSGPALAGVEHWLGLRAVRAAAGHLAAALEAAGSLAALAGQAFAGEARSSLPEDTFAATGFAAEVVVLDERGAVAEIVAAVDAGSDFDPVGAGGQVEGAVHMGLGVALGEQRAVDAQGMPETQFRKLGVLKARVSPPIRALLVPSDGPRPIDDAAMLAVAPAVAAALRARGDDPGEALPMMTSIAAKAAGIKPPRPSRRR